MKRVAILGFGGFVGSAFYRHFSTSGKYEAVGIGKSNYKEFVGQHFDIFINANGSSKKRLAESKPSEDFELNVKSTLSSLLDFKYEKYVYLSTIDVYNDVSNPRNNREDAVIRPESLSNYGFDKYLAELLVRKHAKNWLILRLGGMVGENLSKNAIYDMLNLGKIFVHPDSEYQYMNTSEVASITEKLLLNGVKGEVVNACGKGTVKVGDAAKRFKIALKEVGKEKQKYEVSVSKVESLVGAVSDSWETVTEYVGGVSDGPKERI